MDFFNDVVVYKSFLTLEEIQGLHSYAKTKLDNKQAKPEKWFMAKYKKESPQEDYCRYLYYFKNNETFDDDPILLSVFNKIKDTMELNKFNKFHLDRLIGCVIAYTLPGGFIQAHTDKYTSSRAKRRGVYNETTRHVRFNLMVDRDVDRRYNPHFWYGDDETPTDYNVNIGDAWCFPPDRLIHGTPVLYGDRPRIVYQFGFSIDV